MGTSSTQEEAMKSVTVEREIEVGVRRVVDQDGTNLRVMDVEVDSDGDLLIEVEVPYAPQCSRCKCRCRYDD
jgi:hypothetical protein